MKEGDFSSFLLPEAEPSLSESSEGSVAGVETVTRKCYDGREVTLVSTSTQTEMEMKDIEQFETHPQIIPGAAATADSPDRGGPLAGRLAGLIDQSPRGHVSVGSRDMSITREQPQGFPFEDVPGDEYGIPPLDMASDTDYQRESDYQEQRVSEMNEAAGMLFAGNEEIMTSILSGMFMGTCEFCSEMVKPFPTLEEQQTMEPEELFCCEEYQQFVEYIMQQQAAVAEETSDNLIDIKPHAHYGTQTKDKAKQKAFKLRERELKKEQHHAQMQQQIQQVQQHGMNFYAFARQMKTINYQLSSQKCLEEGWTVRKPTPLIECDEDEETFLAEPTFKTFTQGPEMTERYYEDGSKFMTVFPDSSGNVFYPSGNIAIIITPVTKRQFSFIIMDDMEKSLLIASFDPSGYSFCYHKNGGVRLNIDPLGGIELDTHGSKRRRWQWNDQLNVGSQHIHAPPFQPLCFGLNRYISMRIMSQQNMTLTFSAKSRSCRFSVGARLTLLAPENIPVPEVDENQIFLADRHCYVESLLDKVTTLLRFPKSPKLDKILPPLHLTSKLEKTEKMRKEKVRTAEANKGKRLLPAVVVQ